MRRLATRLVRPDGATNRLVTTGQAIATIDR